MRLWIRLMLRNIAEKPFRTLIIVMCLAAVSLTFSLCLTVSAASGAAVEEQIRRSTGDTDIIITGSGEMTKLPALPEGVRSLPAVRASSYLQQHGIENYKYVKKKSVLLLGTDTAAAQGFGLLPECTPPKDGEAVIGYSLSQRFGFKEGGSITLPCADGTEMTLTVNEVVLDKGLLSTQPNTMIVSPETAKKALASHDIAANVIYADAPDGRETATADLIRGGHPELFVQQVTGTEEMANVMSGLTRTFFLLFFVTLLMMVFIIAAFSKNIAAERLSAVGTLRSIGAEKRTAAGTLLTECAVYGLSGGALGMLLFYALADVLIGGMMPSVNGAGGSVHAPFYIPLTGAVLSAAVSCTVPLTSVVRTSRMPIRDIIFGGKDSVYKPSRAAAVTGLVLLAGTALLYFAAESFAAGAAALAAFIVGLCLVLPMLLSGIAALAARLSSGGRLPVLRLALIQSGTKKTDVNAAVICTAAMLLSSSLFVLSRSADKLYSARVYDCDVMIRELSERPERYRTITADKAEFIYMTGEQTEINGKPAAVTVYGYKGFDMFKGITRLPAALGSGEIALDRLMMKRLGISAGDTVTLTLKTGTVRPVTLSLTATDGIDSAYADERCCGALISLDTYKKVYHDYPSVLLAKGDPVLIRRQLTDSGAVPETAEEYYARTDEESGGVTGLLYTLAAAGMLLAVLSVSGSQMLGFEQRRHELAVLRSQGMSRGQLAKMLLAETAVTALLPAAVFLCAGHGVILLITKPLSSLDINIPISCEPAVLAVFLTAMAAAVILTALIPILRLRRMNTAEQLKCE